MPFLQLQSIQKAHIHLSSPKGRILEDRPHLQRELLLAALAEPDAASLDERVFLRSATRARNNAIRPAKIKGILKAAVGITEVNNRLLKSLRRFHDSNVRLFSCVSSI